MASTAGLDEGESESVGELLHSIRPTNESDGATRFPPGLGVAMELLNEELQQEIAPRKLLRQFSLNIPPYGTSVNTGIGSIGGGGGGSGADSARRFSRSAASPHGLADAAGRLDRHLLRRSTRGSVDSLTELEISVDSDAAGVMPPLAVNVVPATGDLVESNGLSVLPQQPPLASVTRNDTFEAKFGDGFLGLEFVINDTRRQVMVKSVQGGARTKTILQIPPWATITRGLMVDAINGRDVVSLMPEEVIDMLQYTSRPLSVRFRRCEESMVVCKLCECRVDAWSLDEHTNYCVMSRRFELEADQINNALTRLGTSIQANLDSDAMRSLFDAEDLHFYNALRVISIQASSCDVSRVDSFALCSRLIKILDRIRMQEPTDSSNFAVERGLKYCHHIRNLIHAKMSKMRQTQKVLLQQGPNEGRAPFQRTKSLEEIENGSNRSLPISLPSARRPSACRVSIRDFQIVKPISKGAFGKVYLARKKTTGDQYAIKVLAKEHVLRKKQIQHIETERDILVSVESPFVVKLFWTFQTKRNLFLVMEYLPGGDFMSLLECIVQLEEQVARIYIAEVALALYHLHLKGCVHRDLKPDNILISSNGHIKLTDFGLSEEGVSLSDSESESPDGEGILGDQHGVLTGESGEQRIHSPEDVDFEDDFNLDLMNPTRPKRHTKKKRAYSHTYGRCGTPDYLSPEIILNEPHGPPVDFWALGVILYEMLVGFPPFNDETVEAIFNNILERQILWPDGDKCLSDEAIDLINRLLEPDPSKRLDWEGVQNHPFFKGIEWDTLLDSTPPFVPTLEGPNDTSYFNNRNLTDIFIDDEEFDIDSQSVDSNMVDQQSESGAGEDTAGAALGGSTESDENLMNEFGALVGAKTGPSTSSDDKAVVNSGFNSDQEPSDTVSEPSSRHVSIADDSLNRGENNLRFPSGMYSGPREESAMDEAFRSFSFTNMNALAAASRNEAEMIADNHLSEVENSSSLSILI